MNKLYNFKSNSIKKLKQIVKCLNFNKIFKAEYNLLTVIVIIIVVSICTNIAWGKRGSIKYFFREAKQKIILFVDLKKPVISDVYVSNISEYNAKITWKTNELTKTKFYLGTDTDYTLWQESFGRMAYDHWLDKIPSLKPGITYHFKVVAIDRRGNKAEYQNYTFNTLGEEVISDTIPVNDESINDKKANDNNQNLIKSINDTGDIIKKLEPEPKERIDPCLNVNCLDCQYCSFGLCVDHCQGVDDSCGCTDCINCDSSDNWVNVDSSYSCCDENKNCTCQKQEYRDYTCSGTSCDYSVTNTKINKNNCEVCDSSESCISGHCRKTFETSLSFPMIFTKTGNALYLDFSLSNNSFQTITMTKVEFFNKDNKLVHNISAEGIVETWKSNNIKSGGSVSGSLKLKIMYSTEGWYMKWSCLDFYGDTFVVSNLD